VIFFKNKVIIQEISLLMILLVKNIFKFKAGIFIIDIILFFYLNLFKKIEKKKIFNSLIKMKKYLK
jgi:hypothetical protein